MSDDVYQVLVSEELFLELGGDRVEWGHKDRNGFYSPTVVLDDERLGAALHAAIHPSHDWQSCADPDSVRRMIPRFRAAR